MNIVDSSGWLAYFADAPPAKHFHKPLNDPSSLVVPTLTLYEVFTVVLRETTENKVLQAVVAMQKGKIATLTSSLGITAARFSLEYDLPMADSIILATAREYDAVLWTLDSDFKKIKGVNYFPKK